MKKIMLFAAACAALAACNKNIDSTTPKSDNPDAFVKGQEVTLAVSAPSSTKVSSSLDATTGDISFKWEKDDIIKVSVNGVDAEFTLKSGVGTSDATFEGTMPTGGTEFNVQYPYEAPTLGNQTYSSSEAIPHDKMLLSVEGCSINEGKGEFTLVAQNAALRLNLWGTSQTISQIVVTDTNSDTYTLSISPAVTLPTTEAAAQAFFVVVPAGTYSFSAEIFDNSATPKSICKFEPSESITFTANEIRNMAAKEVKKPKYTISYCIDPDTISGSYDEGVTEAAEDEPVDIIFQLYDSEFYFHNFEIEAESGASVSHTFENYTNWGTFTMPASNVTVKAVCKPNFISISETEVELPSEGGEVTIEVSSSWTWMLYSGELEADSYSGGKEGEETKTSVKITVPSGPASYQICFMNDYFDKSVDLNIYVGMI